MFRVGQMANQFYRTGPMSDLNALLQTGTPSTLAEQLTILDRLTRQEKDQIAGVVAVRDKYEAEKRKLDQLMAAAEAEAELAAKRKKIEGEIKQLHADAHPRRTALERPRAATLRIGLLPCRSTPGGKAVHCRVKTACASDRQAVRLGLRTGPNAFDCSGLTQVRVGRGPASTLHPLHRRAVERRARR